MGLGRTGIWTAHFERVPWSEGKDLAVEIEELGYGAVWFPEAVGRDPFVAATLLLDATTTIAAATGIASIYARDPLAMKGAWHTIEAAFPERFVLGLGVSHQPMVEGLRATTYAPPVATMRAYLDGIDAALFLASPPSTPPRRVLAALGPRMLALAAERADGAHPYNVTPEHTKGAREVLGPGKLLAVEQKAVLTNDASEGRDVARAGLGVYLGLPNYVNNWKRLGFTDDDFGGGGSDRFLDAMVVSGDEAAIKARVDAHFAAGADHVCVQPLGTDPVSTWRELAPALTEKS